MTLSLAAFVFLPGIAVSTTAGTSSTSCPGTVQCCDAVEPANNATIAKVLKDYDVTVPSSIPIGLGCLPQTVIDMGNSAKCSGSVVCCSTVVKSAVIGIDCTPYNLGI